MRRPEANPTRLRRQVLRVLGVVCGVAAFLGVATLINPTSSLARAVRSAGGFVVANARPTAGVAQTGTPADRPSLGSLEGPEYRVQIFAARDAATYSVFDAAGRAVVVDAAGDEVYKSLPDLDVRSLMADVEVDSAY